MNVINHLSLLLLVLALSCVACQPKDAVPELPLTATELRGINMCLTENLLKTSDPKADPSDQEVGDRSCGARGKFWGPGEVLTVKFVGGSFYVRSKVILYAQEWEQYANIDFQFVNSGPTKITVAFDPNGGHWSMVGTDSWFSGEPVTMNLEIDESTSSTEIRRHVLHEFGHALGLQHEHQNPNNPIQWDKPRVYAYYAYAGGWDMLKVNEQVLNPLNVWETQYSAYDANSIMHYPIDGSLTLDGYSVPWNMQLSSNDKSFISQVYSPLNATFRHAATDYPYDIRFKINGTYYTVGKGEIRRAYVPPGVHSMYIREKAGYDLWFWDANQSVLLGQKYIIVNDGSPTRFKILPDPWG